MARSKVVALAVVALAGAVLLVAQSAPLADRHEPVVPAGPTPAPAGLPPAPPSPAQPGRSHDYFQHVSALPGVVAAYSLRDEAELAKVRRRPSEEPRVTYDPAGDRDPRKQDAAKFWMSAGRGPSLKTQLWLPTNHQPRTSLLVTWDDWLGEEFRYGEVLDIGGYKAWNLCSPTSGIWTEIQHRMLRQGEELSAVAIRQYNPRQQGPNTITMGGQTINGQPPRFGNYGNNVIGPMAGEFGVRPETWTRYWLFVEPDGDWYRLFLWVADETRDPVQLYNGLQVRPRTSEGRATRASMDGTWDIFRLEFNTSTSGTLERDLVGYARNVVMVQNISRAGVQAVLQRPVR
jgi:hypothetical protein